MAAERYASESQEDNIVYYHWGRDGFSENTKVNDNWEVRVNDDCRVFFVDHASRKTSWEHPELKKKYKVPPYLPYGWQRYKDQKGNLVFVDHLTETCSYIDPRVLLPAKTVFPTKFSLRSFVLLNHRFHSRTHAADVAVALGDCTDKVVVVTGGNSGIGFETAKALASCGAYVIIACRSAIRADEAVQKIQSVHTKATIQAMQLDLGSLHSVRQFAADFKARHLPLHYLILNAAVFGLPYGTTVDGVEQHFGVNHLGHFYLFRLLEDIICQMQSRVVVVSSESHRFPDIDTESLDMSTLANPTRDSYSSILAYGASKLCNVLFALEVDRRYSRFGVTCNAVHPGNMLYTNLSASAGVWYKLMYAIAWPFSRSISQAASSVVFVACHSTASTISGVYFNGFTPSLPSAEARYPGVGAELWELSEQIVHEKTSQDFQ